MPEQLKGLNESASPGTARADMKETLGRAADVKGGARALAPEDVCVFPASLAQARFWFADQLDPGNPAYNIAVQWRLLGRLDPAIVQRAFNEIIRRHEALRTSFAAPDGQPVQVVRPALRIALDVTDLRHLPPAERISAADRLIIEEGARRFNLAELPLIRAGLLRLDDEEHLLLVTAHHIVVDGLSMGVIAGELGRIYDAFSRNAESPLPELPIQYPDFAVWQKQWVESGAARKAAAYWKEKLAGFTPTEIIPDKPRPAAQSLKGEIVAISLPAEWMSRLKEVGDRCGCTLFMTLLAAFNVLLHRYTGQTDIVVGTQVAGRNEETEHLIGALVNSVVLRSDLSDSPSFTQLVERTRETVLGALEYGQMPFEQLVQLVGLARDVSRPPLFGINFTSHAAFVSDRRFAGISLIDTPPRTPGAIYDLNVFVVERPEGWRLSCQYSSDLYRADTVRALLKAFETLLKSVAQGEQSIDALSLLSAEQRERLTIDYNETLTSYPREATIHGLFEEQAREGPERTAIIAGDTRLSYGELNCRANRLAHHLRRRGSGAESIVGVCLERSLDAIVARLAILKAGGVYLALDPSYPKERFARLVRDAAPTAIITREASRAAISGCCSPIVVLDTDSKTISGESSENPSNLSSADATAFLMYTSGSSGQPKGVLIPHRGVVRLVKDTSCLAIDESEVFLQHSSLSFDASTLEIWGPLLNGACIAILDTAEPSLADFDRAIRSCGVTTLWLTAGLFHLIVEERIAILRPLRRLIAGGDVLLPDRVNRVLSELPDLTLINGYGPTENTTFTCCYIVPRGERISGAVPIGRPICNTQVYILDNRREPVPVGVPGELYIAGDGLARGYLNSANLTQAKFVPSPFSSEPGARLYRSGDMARYRADGQIEFLGRIDNQVKINGFRVEPSEIESTLLEHGSVVEAVVIAHESGGVKRLAAYVVPAEGRGTAQAELRRELKEYLGQRLPRYMQPAAIITLAELPLGETGKVNRAKLPAPDQGAERSAPAARVGTDETERRLAAIWEGVLGVKVGPLDNFFDLGGDSLKALRLFARIGREFGKRLPLAVLFRAPTLEGLAEMLRREEPVTPVSSLVAIRPAGSKPPLFIASGIGGHSLNLAKLVRHLPPAWPVYALESPGLERSRPHLLRMEDLAAHQVCLVKAQQPHGPYYLAGYSFGGMVSFEMARQLAAGGDKVALLALLDPPEWGFYAADIAKLALRARVQRYRQRVARTVFGPERIKYLSRAVGWNIVRRVYRVYDRFDRPVPRFLANVRDINTFAATYYVPRQYSGSVTLFRTGASSAEIVRRYESGWRRLVNGEFTVAEIPGEHDDITNEPFVQVLADKLARRLELAADSAQRCGPGSSVKQAPPISHSVPSASQSPNP